LRTIIQADPKDDRAAAIMNNIKKLSAEKASITPPVKENTT